MATKTEIVLCYGSSCFARGNKNLVPKVMDFLSRNGLADKVDFKGQHCFGKCIDGPSIRIGEHYYHRLTDKLVREILTNELLNK